MSYNEYEGGEGREGGRHQHHRREEEGMGGGGGFDGRQDFQGQSQVPSNDNTMSNNLQHCI